MLLKKKVVERFFDMQALIFLLLFVCLFLLLPDYTRSLHKVLL